MPVAPFLKVTERTSSVSLRHYRALPNVTFTVGLDLAFPESLPPDSAGSSSPIEDDDAPLMDIGRVITALGVPVAIFGNPPEQNVFLSSLAQFHNSASHCWKLLQEDTSITLSTDNEGNRLSPVMVLSPTLHWYDVGPDRLGKVSCIMAEFLRVTDGRLWLAEHASLNVYASITVDFMFTTNVKRILTLTLVLEQLALWPVTFRGRRDRFGWLAKDSRFSLATTEVPQNQDSSFTQADLEARYQLPDFSDFPFAHVIKNIWRCKTPEELMDGLRPRPGSPDPALTLFKVPNSTSPERYKLVFWHAQASMRNDFVRNWTDLCISITRVGFVSTLEFKAVMVRMLRCYRDMSPSATSVVTPAQASYALDTFGRQVHLLWPVQVAGRYFERELEAHPAGVDLDKDGKSGWAKME